MRYKSWNTGARYVRSVKEQTEWEDYHENEQR